MKEIQDYTPPKGGNGIHRIDDSDELVVIEDAGPPPVGNVCLKEHGLFMRCVEGKLQFEYDNSLIKMQKGDIFLYMRNSIAGNFMASADYKCSQIWFSRAELWDMNRFGTTSISEIAHLKLNPVIHVTGADSALLDTYFQQLCQRMQDKSAPLYADIVHSLVGTLFIEFLSIMLKSKDLPKELDTYTASSYQGIHKRKIVDRFMQMVEESDGRIRRVDGFASKLNITPKHLSTIVKEVLNRRPIIYIHLFTMKAIEQRLRYTDMTMQEIANDLNFPNASFFGKYFKEHAGMTPLEYRKKYHGANSQTKK